MTGSSEYLIVWDLDGTLGDFTALHEQGQCGTPITITIRQGLADALTALSKAGFTHTLLTLATPLYAEMVLRAADLRSFFERVEGYGQRGKGDAVGLGEVFGISPQQRSHRMIFVGDHPLFDEPRDPRVLFHLEPFALSRPAEDVKRLILALRESGRGSLWHGFESWLSGGSWWKRSRFLRRLWPSTEPVRVTPPGLSDLLLVERREQCPVIGFADTCQPAAVPSKHVFIPAEMALRVKQRS